MNREEYLSLALTGALADTFVELGYPFNEANGMPLGATERVTCGLARRRSEKTEALTLSPKESDGGLTEIFISTAISDSVKVLSVLAREMVRVVVGVDVGNKKAFVNTALRLGFVGPKENMYPAPASEIMKAIRKHIAEYGEYPHDATGNKYDPKPTMLIKAVCPNPDCRSHNVRNAGVVIRITKLWVDAGYIPYCKCGDPSSIGFQMVIES